MADTNENEELVSLHVVEHHPLAVDGLRSLLKAFKRLTFYTDDVPPGLASGSPLIVVVDAGTLTLPFEKFVQAVRRNRPNARVIVLNRQWSGGYLVKLLFLGVVGFVPYDHVAEELEEAIRSVVHGGAWMEAEALEEFARQKLLLAGERKNGALTEREMRVLGLLERGLCNKEIASAMEISLSTVKFHLGNIFAKIGVHDRLRAAEWARRSTASTPS